METEIPAPMLDCELCLRGVCFLDCLMLTLYIPLERVSLQWNDKFLPALALLPGYYPSCGSDQEQGVERELDLKKMPIS